MTIDYEIKHCRETAEAYIKSVFNVDKRDDSYSLNVVDRKLLIDLNPRDEGDRKIIIEHNQMCYESAKEYSQLAEWLEELVVLRKAYDLACDLLANEEDVECQKSDECPNFKDGKCENPMCVKEHFIRRAKEKLQDDA